ncbi:MAG: hypothetical protein B0D92_02815 [Spirochaeta sp. LUC14_002_19_P3]|nr:MAG: hypothetical protein B0D92_02815 [Spirochaeta sp. LUC14_002_19_P3]
MKNLTKPERAWVLYDWANSAHTMIIATTLFPLWFGQTARNGGLSDTQTTFWLGTTNMVYSLIVAIFAAFLGTVSDFRGSRKKLFTIFWILGIAATASLVLVDNSAWKFALILYAVSFIGFAGANIAYDASLPGVTSPERMDMVSAMGFGYGYIGGSTIPFIIGLAVIAWLSGMNLNDGLPALGVKISFALAALWWFIFTFPYLKHVKQVHGIEPVPHPVAASFRKLIQTFREIRKYKKIFLFLVAYFFYIDGVNTIIKMATNFASSIGVGFVILLIIVILIQLFAFPFALLYGKLANRFGAGKMLFTGIGIYIIITAIGIVMPLVPQGAVVPLLFIVSFLVASSQGGIQALSRSYFASLLSDKNNSGEFFGFYNTMGKFAAVLGPLLMGGAPRLASQLGIADEHKAYSFGIGSIFILLFVGVVFLVASVRVKNDT